MVTEDYVSFETAKLLKEKGFNVYVRSFYDADDMPAQHTEALWDWNLNKENYRFSAPTLQIAMKWLRNTHQIDIEVRTHYLDYLKPNDTRYYSGKIFKGSEDVVYTIHSKDTYEEVCEEGIRYCLENLI